MTVRSRHAARRGTSLPKVAFSGKGGKRLSIESLARIAWHRDRLPTVSELGDLPEYRRRARLYRDLHQGGWTMVGPRRGRMLQRLAAQVERDGIPGALVDCGAWNGGSTIMLTSGAPGRDIWAFDSFEGLPEPEVVDRRPDLGGGQLVGSQAKLRDGFQRFQPGARLRIGAGWFEDTLPGARERIGTIAVLHVDGDWYESVWNALEVLYPIVAVGGFVIIDDYATFAGARQATDNYRARVGESGRLRRIDHSARYWRRG